MSEERQEITAACQTAGCVKQNWEIFQTFPQARRFAKEHARHTGHAVQIKRHEIHVYGPEDEDDF